MDQKATAAARFDQEAQAGADALRAQVAAQDTQVATSSSLAQGFFARADSAERSCRELADRLARLSGLAAGPVPNPDHPWPPPEAAVDATGFLTAVERYKRQFAEGVLKLAAPREMTVERAGWVTLTAAVPEALARLEQLLSRDRDPATVG